MFIGRWDVTHLLTVGYIRGARLISLKFFPERGTEKMSLKDQKSGEPDNKYIGHAAIHSRAIQNLEREMVPVKRSMEERGLNVDLPKLEDLIAQKTQEKRDIELKLRDVLGIEGSCNLNSSRDVALILSEKLGVEPKKTKTGRYTTERRLLKEINNPVTDEIVRYRELEKLLSSLKAIHKATDKKRNKIFCTYIDTCPSGRLYTKGYSFQGIPEEARRVIYPDEGCSFVLADYDTFELRIISALSHDKFFRDCWAKGLDLHRKVISDMKNIPYDSVTDKERKLGKILSFGISYLQEPAGLARNLHTTIPEAERLMRDYKKRIPEIERFKLEVIEKARQTGFVETYHGRRRFLPDITSPRAYDRKKAERQAINTKIQGTAADVVKIALVSLHKEDFVIDTMVHDSVLLTVPDTEVEQSLQRIKEIMEGEIESMKFPVSLRTGETWGTVTEV